VAEKAGMSTEKLMNVLGEISAHIEAIEKTFSIKLGPRSSLEKKHENFANNFLISYIDDDKVGASTSLIEAAKIRRCLG
jgi:putative aminopeptidase FrvX